MMRPLDPSLRTRRVQITKGFGGTEVVAETLIRGRGLRRAVKWLLSHVPDPQYIKPYNRYILEDDSVIVDYGSYTFFGLIVPVNETRNTNTKETTMSKKKPYSRIENGKTLRSIESEYKRNCKAFEKEKVPAWYINLADEFHYEITKVIKLRDFLWVKDTKESEARLSDEAQQVCPKALKLLIKQEKAMTAFCKILGDRLSLGWPKDPASLPCKKGSKKAPAKKGK